MKLLKKIQIVSSIFGLSLTARGQQILPNLNNSKFENNHKLRNHFQVINEDELINAIEKNSLEELLFNKGILIKKNSASSVICGKCGDDDKI